MNGMELFSRFSPYGIVKMMHCANAKCAAMALEAPPSMFKLAAMQTIAFAHNSQQTIGANQKRTPNPQLTRLFAHDK
jgi:hypothetical protein